MTVKLFKQNPKVEKYKPSPMTRSVLSFDLDRKNELNRFGKWLEFVAEEKSDLPKEDEFKQLDKSIKSANPKGFNLMGIVKMLPMAGLALGALGTLGTLGLGALGVGGGILGSAIGGIGAAITGAVGLGALGLKGIVKLAKPFVMKPLRAAFGGLKRFALRIPGVRPLVNLARRGGQTGLKGLIAKLSPKALTRLAGFLGKNVLLKFVKKIPLIGPLIDFAVRYWIFKEPLQKAIFVSAAAALGGVLLGTIGSLAGPLGTLAGGLIGQIAGDALGSWIYGAFFDSPEVTSAPAPEEIGTNIDNLLPATTTENPGVQRTGAESQQAQVTSGSVVQWLHGNPDRPGYDLGHAGKNAHDHFSFSSRGAAVAAYKALRAAGYKPTEFEGFGRYKTSGMRPGSHSPGGGHFGPVGGTPTYDDVTDGVAFDIPWSTYGSGPITQKDYDLSYRAAQIVGAVQGGNVMGTPGQGMLVSNPDSSRTTESQKMPENAFEAMATMFGFGPNATTAAQPAPPAPKEVAMFTPEAEMANADNVVVITQPAQPGTETVVPFPISGGTQGGGQDIAVGGDVSLNSMYDELVLTKLALT